MTVALILLGLFWILCGIAIKFKKWIWIHQGLFKRPVDVYKYINFMGIVDIIAGISCIIIGFMSFYFKIHPILVFILFITLCIFTIYGEVKYRIKSVNQKSNSNM